MLNVPLRFNPPRLRDSNCLQVLARISLNEEQFNHVLEEILELFSEKRWVMAPRKRFPWIFFLPVFCVSPFLLPVTRYFLVRFERAFSFLSCFILLGEHSLDCYCSIGSSIFPSPASLRPCPSKAALHAPLSMNHSSQCKSIAAKRFCTGHERRYISATTLAWTL